ncbi:response regulator transcription factor [Imbroritus primus]|uniref:Response regulator transcription factor n=1 Tax=Imbroritus primus TaxID=3058603 RepID=A0ACD3ST65_9BURK|nr:response regulator transcription factor [Burkholderiaceae bacterium PBA]
MRIAILEDEFSQAQFVSQLLVRQGHSCFCFSRGRELMQRIRRETYDLLFLDWGLPDVDGLSVLRWVRQNVSPTLPVVFMTSRATESDIVEALGYGADDYMVKPLRQAELIARVEALARRAYPATKPAALVPEVLAGYTFDARRNSVTFRGETVSLTQKEFELALILFRNISRPLSRSYLHEIIWGRDHDIPSRTMDTHISRIRTKLELRPDNGFRLFPVYSYGYRLELVDSAPCATTEPTPVAMAS